MLIVGCDYHPGMQQIAWFDEESGECGEQRLEHNTGEAERFYRERKRPGVQVRMGIEASGHTRWLERLLAELEMELWIGNPAKIAAQRVRKQKTDRGEVQPLLQLLREDRFPRVWVPSPENRDLRQLLWHRHRPAASLGVDDGKSFPKRAKWRSSPECTPQCAQKTLDTADGFIDVAG